MSWLGAVSLGGLLLLAACETVRGGDGEDAWEALRRHNACGSLHACGVWCQGIEYAPAYCMHQCEADGGVPAHGCDAP